MSDIKKNENVLSKKHANSTSEVAFSPFKRQNICSLDILLHLQKQTVAGRDDLVESLKSYVSTLLWKASVILFVTLPLPGPHGIRVSGSFESSF